MKSSLLHASLILVLATCFGCTRATTERDITGTVKGTVKYNGEAVTGGDINFYSPQSGASATTTLDASGGFAFEAPLQAGKYKIFILPTTPKSTEGPGGAPPEAPPALTIPAKYQQMETSDKEVEVKQGENVADIVLMD